MTPLHGEWGRFEVGITGWRRLDMKRTAARRRRRADRRALAQEPDNAVYVDANRQTLDRWHWSRDAMW